jgi:predicted nucleic acid-binding protein
VVARLLDTSIVVDLLRAYPKAVEWFETETGLSIPRAAILEVLEGAQDSKRQRQAIQLIKRLEYTEHTEVDLINATAMLSRFGLSHGVDAFDCMIAATSQRLNVPVLTRNLKHFRPLISDLAISPY